MFSIYMEYGSFFTFFQQKFDWEIDNISVHVYTALEDWNYMLKAEDLNTMPTYFFKTLNLIPIYTTPENE